MHRKYHENVFLYLEALHKINPDVPTYSQQFTGSMVCEDSTDNCYISKCDHCRDGALFKQKYPVETIEAGMECSGDEDEEVQVTWYQ